MAAAAPHALAQPIRLGLQVLAVALAYYFTARLGLLIPYVGTHVSLVWLPTGVAIAAYLRWGGQMAWGVIPAAFIVNHGLGGPLWMSVGVALGNAVGPWVSVLLMRRSSFDMALTERSDLGLYLSAVVLGMLITASNGSTWLWLGNAMSTEQWASTWMSWWVGDSVGALLGGVPLVSMSRSTVRESFGRGQGPLNIALLGLVLVCSMVSFSSWLPSALLFPLLSVPLFVTAVLALRAGVLAASLAVLLLSGAAAWATAMGHGPFAGHDPQAGLLALWTYITAQACTSVLICGLAAELLANRRQQASLFQHADAGILLVNPEGRVGAINARAAAMLGVDARAFRGQALLDLPQANGASLLRSLNEGVNGGAAASYLALRKPDGQALQVELQGVRYIDARGQSQTQLLLRDVTERMQAEARLAASEQRLRMITNNVPALIAYMDTDRRFHFVNTTFLEWFDLQRADVIGRRGEDVFGEEAYRSRLPVIEQVIRTGQRGDFEGESDHGGRHRFFRSSYLPDLRADGTVQGLYVLTMDITELKAVETALTRLARFDHLTGLPNRLHFEDKLQEALARARRSGQGLALLYIDVDHFKAINDGWGHAAGDLVLSEFGRRLKASVRATDTVARLAGDEFVAVLEHLGDADEAALVAAKISVAMQRPIELKDGTVTASASIGIGYSPAAVGPRSSAAEMMAVADAALYEAKRGGRNTFRRSQI